MILSHRDLLQLLMRNLPVTLRKPMGLACFTGMGYLSQHALFRPFCSLNIPFAPPKNCKLEDGIDIMKIQRSHVLLVRLLAAIGLVLTLVLIYWLAFTPQQQTLTGTPVPVPGDDWPTYLHDVQRSAASGEVVLSPSNAERLTKLWSFKTGVGIAPSATIVNNTVYIGSWDGYEYALDALKGFLKWKTYLGISTARCVPPKIGITSSATVQNNIVYVGG